MASAPTVLPMFAAMNQLHTSAPTYDLYDPLSLDYNSIDPGLLLNRDLVAPASESHGNFDNVDNMLSTYFMPTTLDDSSFDSQPSGFPPHTSHSHHDPQEAQDYLQNKAHSPKRAPRTDSPSSPTSPTPSRKKRDSVVSSSSQNSHISGAEQRTRNKEAAVRSRQKRGRENDQLITDERGLTAKHHALQDCLSGLEQEVFALNNMLLEHKDCNCDVIRQYYQRKAERKAERKKGSGRKK